MTNPHPLTDEVIDSNENWGCVCYEGIMYDHSDLRAAADWQLQQVIKWIEANPIEDYVYTDYSGAIVKEKEFLKNLKQAMRPQEDN